MTILEEGVRLQKTVTRSDGTTHFVDEFVQFTKKEGPLHSSAVFPAAGLSFRTAPGDFKLQARTARRKRLILVTEGAVSVTVSSGEDRIFRPGDILQTEDTWGEGHAIHALQGKPFSSTSIALEDEFAVDQRAPTHGNELDGVTYTHNQETAAGVSYFEHKVIPFAFHGSEGKETSEIPLKGYQLIFAESGTNYDWHPAPQKQAVLMLTGGVDMEYGDGSQTTVGPGGFLIGEDTDGKGHITRNLYGKPRLSLFAHLAS